MFRILSRYVFREILTSALLGTLLATFVIFLQEAASKLFEVLVNSNNVAPRTVLELFGWAMPPVLPLTIPFGVLVGILIGLGRMASDGEITAMRAAGVSSRKVIVPVLVFAGLGMGLAAFASLRLAPLSMRETQRIVQKLAETQLSAQVEPRVFNEDFPNKILWIGDVGQGPVVKWKPVFIADVTPPEQRQTGMRDKAVGPLITVAREALAVSDPVHNRIELTLHDYSTHEMGKDMVANDTTAPSGVQGLDASPPKQESLRSYAMNTRQLMAYPRNGPDYTEVRIELHKRFALPLACITLALVGIPLGIATRKGGKSAGYVIGFFLGFFCYNLSSVALIGVAKQKTLPVPVAVWLPNFAFLVAGLILLYRMERPGDRDLLASFSRFLGRFATFLTSRADDPSARPRRRLRWVRLPLVPQIIDTYILTNFLFYLILVLASLVSMILVYNFFELMGDMIRNKIPLSEMFIYLFFLTPEMIYEMLPFSVLVAALIQLGVLSKQNEINAFKACGVSLYRLALPVLLGCTLFSAALFAFDYSYVPSANVRQDALRDEIKGRPKQTYLRLDHKWIMGHDSRRIYYYVYFDPSADIMAGVNVFDLDPKTFQLKREIVAERAQWDPYINKWLFENGWSCEFQSLSCSNFKSFASETATFPDLTEAPDYFLTEVVQEKQMNFLQLDRYIRSLQERGFRTAKLQVQYYLKFAVPLFALIMAMIAVPFGFLVGSRGAMTGIGISLAIGISYKGLGILFEKLGDAGLLWPTMAAWSPDVLFALGGAYLLLRMRS
ncbi:MAG TPA: LptF/LptG family permease [Bryobacteraceae bacterium]|nr:LptF/LptG family permease [Bryobacteraceae bacterium]